MSSNHASVIRALTHPSPSSRVMVRWWWFGTTNTEKEIDQQLDAMLKAGIGGVELCYVYPVTPDQSTKFGSPEFLKLVRYAAEGCRKRDMRFDTTIGSGWSFGGAHVTQEHAAQQLRFERRAIGPGALKLPLAGRWPGDKLVAAWVCSGAIGETSEEYEPLKINDNVVSVPAGGAPRTVLLATSGHTTQQLKRASYGAEGPTLDHYTKAATLHHLKSVGDPFLEAVDGKNVTSVFCDSLEVYHSDWSATMGEEFTKRRGYDPVPLLYHLNTSKPEGDAFRAEFYRVLSEVYEDNFLAVCHEWAHQHDTKFRVQNYGCPPCRVSGYKHADMVEGEGWGWTRIAETKWASSAAHHLGVDIVSSETWTWLNSPSFKARPLDFKGEAHEHVLLGINQFIGHGWPSSPLDIVEPGWAFYASCAITDRNAWWEVASGPMFAYLHRLSEVMRQGEPVADIGLWMPYEDTYAGMVHEEELNLWRRSAKQVGESVPRELRQAGYDYDCLDSGLSTESICRRHKVIVVAGSTRLSKEDTARLEEVSANGTPIVVVDSKILPKATHTTRDKLLEALGKIVPPDMATGCPAIGAAHRRLADAELYFVANTSAEPQELHFRPRSKYASWERWDLHDGSVVRGTGDIDGKLAPYEGFVYITSVSKGETTKIERGSSVISLATWTFQGQNGDEKVKAPHPWKDDNFVGTAKYTTTVDLSGPLPSRLVLDTSSMPTPSRSARRGQSFEAHAADPIGVVAVVRVNGEKAGVLWDPPYELAIGGLLKQGQNTIELAISTLSVAHLRSDAWRQIWKDTEAAHGRRFIMQEIEYAFEPNQSGLLVVPELR